MDFPPIDMAGRRVVPDVPDDADPVAVAALRELFSDGAALEGRSRAAILDSLRKSGDAPALLYVTHHLEELPDLAERLGIADAAAPSVASREAFCGAMQVRGIWTSLDPHRSFVHVDYTIDEPRTQYILSVALDRGGAVTSVEMES